MDREINYLMAIKIRRNITISYIKRYNRRKRKGVSKVGLPTTLANMDIAGILGGIVQCYRDTKINAEIQETEREKVRQQARVFIAQYEKDTEKAIAEIQSVTEQNIEIIRTIGNIMCRDNVDTEIIEFCKILLGTMK